MAITSGDFFVTRTQPDPWGGAGETTVEDVDRDRLSQLIVAPDPGEGDLDVTLALMDLVRDDLLVSGTGGVPSIRDEDMRVAIRALERVAARAGHEFKLPFRDHSAWHGLWFAMVLTATTRRVETS